MGDVRRERSRERQTEWREDVVKTMRASFVLKREVVDLRRGRRRTVRIWWPMEFTAKIISMDCGERE